MLMAIFLEYSTFDILPVKKVCCELWMATILKILKNQTQLQFDLRYDKNIPNYAKKMFPWWWHHRWVHRVASNFPLCLREVGSGIKLQGQCLVTKCKYRNRLSRLYMPKDYLNEWHFSRLQVKGQRHRLTGWPWHLNGIWRPYWMVVQLEM